MLIAVAVDGPVNGDPLPQIVLKGPYLFWTKHIGNDIAHGSRGILPGDKCVNQIIHDWPERGFVATVKESIFAALLK